jgi:hypothetical protein
MNIEYYKTFNKDVRHLSNEQAILHYMKIGKNKKKIGSEKDFYQKFPEFNLDIYKTLYDDLKNYDKLRLYKHYYYDGITEKRISSIKEFYKKYNITYESLKKLFINHNNLTEKELIILYINKYIKNINISIKQIIPKKRVAIIFYGLTRCLEYTIKSIKKNIFEILTDNNFEYDIFIHTYKIYGSYVNEWSEENIKLYKNENIENILNPKYYLFDNQDEIIKSLDFDKYCKYLTWFYQTPSKNPLLNKYIIRNLVLALYSKNKITNLFRDYISDYDYAIISRPDLEFKNKIDIKYFNELNDKNIIIPKKDSYEGCNDRFCIGKPNVIFYYGTLYNSLYEYSLKKGLNSERYLLDMLNKKNIKIISKDINYDTIRAK